MKQKLIILITIFCLFFLSCSENAKNTINQNSTQQKTTTNGKNAKTQGFFDKCMKVCAVLGADLIAGYSGAKIGGLIGAVVGPATSAVGAGIGCVICGAGASYATGTALSIVAPSGGSGLVGPNSPYKTNPNTLDSTGFLHNDLVQYLSKSNMLDAITNKISTFKMYSKSLEFFNNRGYDTNYVKSFIDYSTYNNLVQSYLTVDSLDDI